MDEQPSIYQENDPAMINEILLRAQEIEARLQELSDEDFDELCALIDAVADELPEEVKNQLAYIDSVRDQAANEDAFVLSEEEMCHFNQTADSVMLVLNNIELHTQPQVQTQPQIQVDINTPAAPAPATPAARPVRSGKTNVEVEKELFDSLKSKIMFLGFFPIVGVVQQLFLLLSAVFKQFWVVLLTLFYLCSIVLIVKSLHSPIDKNLLYFGSGLFVLTHCCVTIIALKLPIFRKKVKLLWCIPGINMLYLPLRWVYDLQWGKVLLALCGLGCFAAAIYMAFQKNIEWMFLTLLASWIFSIVANCIWGWRREK